MGLLCIVLNQIRNDKNFLVSHTLVTNKLLESA
nr:MAG TPA: hypothetical protein [Caudoviricetes sp.]